MNRRWIAGTAVAAAAMFAGTSQAQAGSLYSGTVRAKSAVAQDCIKRPIAAGRGVGTRSVSVPSTGWVTANLSAGSGDWDVAIFDRATRSRVAGSTFFGATEHAQGFVTAGQDLVVQACHRSGRAGTARLNVSSTGVEVPKNPPTLSLVRVSVPSAARKSELTSMGLDLTEHGGKGFVEVVLHGAQDARKLREAKFAYTNEVSDLAAQSLKDRRAERRASGRAQAAGLPSGARSTYRRLDDYNQEMKTLASRNPNLVKPLTLPFKTLTGLPVQGIEISEDVKERDGKPVFLQMGIHHAREWPSGEHAIEWAYELVNGYKAENAQVRRLMRTTRTIVIPVVNPEGFNTSREAGERLGLSGGRPNVNTPGGDPSGTGLADTTDTAYFATTPYEYQRKNCRVNNPDGDDPEQGDCTQAGTTTNTGTSQFGTDPNRNYGGFWGGPGASAGGPAPGGDFAQDYRGDGPFSERETQNIRALISARQVTTLITNHTFSNLVLRPPGIRAQGPPPDEPIYKALGDSMAGHNGYASQKSYELYDTTGGTEDWSYYSTGGLGFTFEIGLLGFHPQYSDVVAQYEGTTQEAGNRGGNRAAYFKALENTADSSKRSTVTGKAPPGAILRLKKSFTTFTSPVIDMDGVEGARQSFPDTLESTIAGEGRRHVLVGDQPVHAAGRAEHHGPGGHRSAQQPAGHPRPGSGGPRAAPPARAVSWLPVATPTSRSRCPGAPADNAAFSVKIDWGTANSDYDLYVYKDDDGNGQPDGAAVASSAAGSTNSEVTSFGEPDEKVAGKRFIARVVNFAGVENFSGQIAYQGPKPPTGSSAKESYELTCEGIDGQVGESTTLQIDRAQRKTVDFSRAVRARRPGPRSSCRGSASRPRAAPRARAWAPHGSGATAPSSARRSWARCCRTARASTATA